MKYCFFVLLFTLVCSSLFINEAIAVDDDHAKQMKAAAINAANKRAEIIYNIHKNRQLGDTNAIKTLEKFRDKIPQQQEQAQKVEAKMKSKMTPNAHEMADPSPEETQEVAGVPTQSDESHVRNIQDQMN